MSRRVRRLRMLGHRSTRLFGRLVGCLAALALVAACATPVPFREGDPPLPDRPPERTVAEMVDIYDPIEGINRQVYAFNYEFDRIVFLPVVRTYKFILPQVIRDRINDFLGNFDDVVTAANLLLQARPGRAAQTLFRVGVNLGLGFFGTVDIASAVGMVRYSEDFGQTLGYWGTADGPYLVVPILGPSNARDATGTVVDSFAIDPLGVLSNLNSDVSPYAWTRTGVNAVDTRANTPFRYHETGSPFEYDYVRLLYTRKRELDIIR